MVIEVGVLTWTSVWSWYVGPAVTLRMKDFGSIRFEPASKSVGICGGMWKEGREKLKGGRVRARCREERGQDSNRVRGY